MFKSRIVTAGLVALAVLSGPVAPMMASDSPADTGISTNADRASTPATKPRDVLAPSVPGELIISFQAGVTARDIAAFYQKHRLLEKEDLGNKRGDAAPKDKLVKASAKITRALLDTLAVDPRVRYAEPNYLVTLDVVPNDPQLGDLWGLNNTGQTGGTADADIDAPEAWDVSTGSDSVIVGVVDTGVSYNHEDLAANMWTNPAEIAGDGIDNDGNGYIDDIHGINVSFETGESGDPRDDNGHGTHVAGTIGARGNNGVGVTGVNWNVRIVACKFIDALGSGSVARAVRCFKYLNYLKHVQGQNVVVTNNSWGGGEKSQALEEAMAGRDQPGMAPILHVCAAGNDNFDNGRGTGYPSSLGLDNIIAVAATNHDDLYPAFSNYGATAVDLAAPGVSIRSTYHQPANSYASLNGTSMAVPHVAGVAGLVWAAYPVATALDVKQRILAGTDYIANIGSNANKPTLTNGRLNAYNALENDDTTPPAAVSTLQGAGETLSSVTLEWTASGDDGSVGGASYYDLRYAPEAITEANWAAATQTSNEPRAQPSGATERMTVTGLDPGTTYHFALKVSDNRGNESGVSNDASTRTDVGTVGLQDDMESGTASWTATGLWHPSAHRANSPTTAWYYGKEDTWTYNTGTLNKGTMTSRTIDLAGAPEALLTFSEWNQQDPNPYVDSTKVEVSTGAAWTTVFEGHGTDNAWVQRSLDLTPFIQGAASISVRFSFAQEIYSTVYEGWYIDDVRVLVNVPDAAPPAPVNLRASALNSYELDLLWDDRADNEAGFKIERSADGTNFTQIGTTYTNVTRYVDKNLLGSTTFVYRVRAYNAAGDSGYSDDARGTTLPSPFAPSDATATASSGTRIDVRWADRSDNEDYFLVEVSTNGTYFYHIATLNANVTTWTDISVCCGATYYYRVRAYNRYGYSLYSNTAAATMPAPPAAPSNLTATALSNLRITLTWTDNSNNETSFYVWRSTDGVNFGSAVRVDANVTTLTETGLSNNTVYYYRVSGHDGATFGPDSNTASAKARRR